VDSFYGYQRLMDLIDNDINLSVYPQGFAYASLFEKINEFQEIEDEGKRMKKEREYYTEKRDRFAILDKAFRKEFSKYESLFYSKAISKNQGYDVFFEFFEKIRLTFFTKRFLVLRQPQEEKLTEHYNSLNQAIVPVS